MNVPAQVHDSGGYRDVIARAATDPNFRIEVFDRLIAAQREWEMHIADTAFNDNLSAAEAEISTVITDAPNPQTKKRYATFPRLDSACRPVYTKFGFGIRYDTEDVDANNVLVFGHLSRGMITRTSKITMPIETTGMKGSAMTTRTWAKAAAITYGRRQLLIMLFNLAIADADDDGAAAAERQPPRPPRPQAPEPSYLVDPQTGEILPPHTVERRVADGQPEARFDWAVRLRDGILGQSKSEADINEWLRLNATEITTFKTEAPQMFAKWEARVNQHRNAVKMNQPANQNQEVKDDAGPTR